MLSPNQLKRPHNPVKSMEGSIIYFSSAFESSFFYNRTEEIKHWEESGTFQRAIKNSYYCSNLIQVIFSSYAMGHSNKEQTIKLLKKMDALSPGIMSAHAKKFERHYFNEYVPIQHGTRYLDLLEECQSLEEGKSFSLLLKEDFFGWIKNSRKRVIYDPDGLKKEGDIVLSLLEEVFQSQVFPIELSERIVSVVSECFRRYQLPMINDFEKQLVKQPHLITCPVLKGFNYLNIGQESLHPAYEKFIKVSDFPFSEGQTKLKEAMDFLDWSHYSDKYWNNSEFLNKMTAIPFFYKKSGSYFSQSKHYSMLKEFILVRDEKGNHSVNPNRILLMMNVLDTKDAETKADFVETFYGLLPEMIEENNNFTDHFNNQEFFEKCKDWYDEVKNDGKLLHVFIKSLQSVMQRIEFSGQSENVEWLSPQYFETEYDFDFWTKLIKIPGPYAEKLGGLILTSYQDQVVSPDFNDFVEHNGYYILSLAAPTRLELSSINIHKFQDGEAYKKLSFERLDNYKGSISEVKNQYIFDEKELKEMFYDYCRGKDAEEKQLSGWNLNTSVFSYVSPLNAGEMAVYLLDNFTQKSREERTVMLLDWLLELINHQENPEYIQPLQNLKYKHNQNAVLAIDEYVFECIRDFEGFSPAIVDRVLEIKNSIKDTSFVYKSIDLIEKKDLSKHLKKSITTLELGKNPLVLKNERF